MHIFNIKHIAHIPVYNFNIKKTTEQNYDCTYFTDTENLTETVSSEGILMCTTLSAGTIECVTMSIFTII